MSRQVPERSNLRRRNEPLPGDHGHGRQTRGERHRSAREVAYPRRTSRDSPAAGHHIKTFAEVYLRDHAELHKRSVSRDREILRVLNRSFGSLILHEITTHRIEQFKRERLAEKWRGHNTSGPPRPIKPATVNRELDTLKSLLSKAVEWASCSTLRPEP